ncbi:MAG: exodeoxyribonuclease I [Gammaproteobacteria bacterium]|nr:exodeoxyribonuclease I [Gammaproteobacteria bacterium]
MEKTYLFYDVETTGLNKCFDQVLQFAAIRTDKQFNELEQYEYRIKLNLDVIPSPQAIITHGIGISEMQNGTCEYEAVQEIHKLMNQPGTISLGYNTLGFDDEFLRFSFYRNLLTPYTHQYANGCSRMDLLPMTAMYYLFKNEVLTWPTIDKKPSLKLEPLSNANKLAEGAAHDAMVDVKATLSLAKCLAQHQDMWNYLCGYFDKATDLGRMLKLPEAVMVDVSFGADNFYQAPVSALGPHNHYKNQTLWLRLDDEKLSKTTSDSIADTTFVIRKKVGESKLLLPPNERFLQHITKKRSQLIEANKKWLAENSELLQEISRFYKDYTYPEMPNLDIDAALYQNGFLSRDDQSQCDKFHAASINDKVIMLEHFTNSNMREQAIRIIGRNYKYLPHNYAMEFESYLGQINPHDAAHALLDYKGKPRYTPMAALKEIAELKAKFSRKADAKQLELLQGLEEYLYNHYVTTN